MNRSRLLLLTVLFALALVAPPSALAGYGDLDPSFGSGGVARPFLPAPASDPYVVVGVRLLPDGRVLVARAGYVSSGGSLIRLKRDGSVDKTFSEAKAREAAIRDGSIDDVEVLDDGRIAVLTNAGPYKNVQTRLALLKKDGEADTQFGNQGLVSLGIESSGLRAHSIAVQNGSKILVSGYRDGSKSEITLARFNSDGSSDTTFGEGGEVVVPGTSFGAMEFAWDTYGTTALDVARSGEIYLGIDAQNSPNSKAPAVAKLTADGDLIAGYGVNGLAAIPNLFRHPIYTVAATDGGDVGIAGRYTGWNKGTFTTFDAGLLNSQGTFYDPDGGDPNAFSVASVAALADHRFVLGGPDYVRATFADSDPDPDFGDNGTTRPLLKNCGPWSQLDVGSDGSTVAAGFGCGQLTLIRLHGRDGGSAAPRVLITAPPKPIYRRSSTTHGMVVAGQAAPAHAVERVEIAIRRISGKRCQWFTKGGAKRITLRKRKGKCDRPRFMRATGSQKWHFELRHALPKGEYQIYARAVTDEGLKTPLTQAPESYARFNVMTKKRP